MVDSVPRPRWNFGKAKWTTYAAELDMCIRFIQPKAKNYHKFIGLMIAVAKKHIPRGFRKLDQNSSVSNSSMTNNLVSTSPTSNIGAPSLTDQGVENNHPEMNAMLAVHGSIRLLLSQIPALYTNFCSFPPLASFRNVQRAIVPVLWRSLMSAVYIMAVHQICFICEKTLRNGDTVVVKAKGLNTLKRSSQLREDGKSDTVLIVLDDDNAEDVENVSDQIQDDEDQTDNAELAEMGRIDV
ncbi:hypothetical protein JTB14_019823 [Gonioctena quinquepunctata]|nr:hypothetical protein JTB14_019823 [Gonioctena quinquepunctata]